MHQKCEKWKFPFFQGNFIMLLLLLLLLLFDPKIGERNESNVTFKVFDHNDIDLTSAHPSLGHAMAL